jgi:hypothetical protein
VKTLGPIPHLCNLGFYLLIWYADNTEEISMSIAMNKAGKGKEKPARAKRRKLVFPVQGGQKKQIKDMVDWAEKGRRTK